MTETFLLFLPFQIDFSVQQKYGVDHSLTPRLIEEYSKVFFDSFLGLFYYDWVTKSMFFQNSTNPAQRLFADRTMDRATIFAHLFIQAHLTNNFSLIINTFLSQVTEWEIERMLEKFPPANTGDPSKDFMSLIILTETEPQE